MEDEAIVRPSQPTHQQFIDLVVQAVLDTIGDAKTPHVRDGEQFVQTIDDYLRTTLPILAERAGVDRAGLVGLWIWLILPDITNPFFFALLFWINGWFPSRRPWRDVLWPLVAVSRAYFARYPHSAQPCGFAL